MVLGRSSSIKVIFWWPHSCSFLPRHAAGMVLTGTPDNAGCWCESYCARRVRLPTAREAFGFLYDLQDVQTSSISKTLHYNIFAIEWKLPLRRRQGNLGRSSCSGHLPYVTPNESQKVKLRIRKIYLFFPISKDISIIHLQIHINYYISTLRTIRL